MRAERTPPMRFLLGFPVDSGSVELSFIVLVRTIRAKYHWCRGGGKSELRTQSGARFAFEHAPREIQDQCRFEFEPLPSPSNERYNKPDQLCNVGYSDAAACALAIAQYHPGGTPLEQLHRPVLISCSFAPNHQLNQGLSGLILDKVTHENPEESRKSLKNKWIAAQKYRALALVLHEEDAKLLAQNTSELFHIFDLRKDTFVKLARQNLEETPVIACKSDQFPLLAEALTINPSLFQRGVSLRYSPLFLFLSLSFLVTILFWKFSFEVPRLKEGLEIALKGDIFPLSPLLEEKSIQGLSLDLDRVDKEDLSFFLEALLDKDPKVRIYGAWALGKIGSEAAESIPDLMNRLTDESEEVRLRSIWAIGQMASKANYAIPKLLALVISDPNAKVRMQAVVALGNIGQKEAVPTLLKAIQDKDWTVRLETVLALDRIGPTPEVILAMMPALSDPNKYVRRHTAWVLGNCGTKAKETIQELLKCLQDEDKYVRMEAGEAIKKIIDLEVRRRD